MDDFFLIHHDNFNSHARVGRDCAVPLISGFSFDFNSHARVGRDMPFGWEEPVPLIFQLTRPCRA